MTTDDQQRIAELEQEVSELREQLVIDELTRVYNRRGLSQLLSPVADEVNFQMSNPERRRNVIIRDFSLIFIDLDHFKKINDTYGHEAGDLALRHVAEILRSQIRGIDIVGRWGGEELLVGLVGAGDDDAERIAEEMRRAIESSVLTFDGQEIRLTASFGVAKLQHGETVDDLTKRADAALYEAKNSGRNKVVAAK